jgi:hypothetical protein
MAIKSVQGVDLGSGDAWPVEGHGQGRKVGDKEGRSEDRSEAKQRNESNASNGRVRRTE